MATEREKVIAREILARSVSRLGERHSRIHEDGLDRNQRRLAALKGLCGNCENLRIISHEHGQGSSVQLNCQYKNPLDLYSSPLIVNEPECEFQISKNKED